MRNVFKFSALVIVLGVLPYLAGTARAAFKDGGISTSVAAERQMVNVLRGDFNRAAYRRCNDERTSYQYPDVRLIPARLVHRQRVTWEGWVEWMRAKSRPREHCWRSHLWAESWAGRCVSSREGSLRSVSAGGTYAGKWQSDRSFEMAYARWWAVRHGRAYNWPEHAQDLMGWRGWSARGWQPWPSTARACGLL